jgi:Fe-Mn family superoxide dismutase
VSSLLVALAVGDELDGRRVLTDPWVRQHFPGPDPFLLGLAGWDLHRDDDLGEGSGVHQQADRKVQVRPDVVLSARANGVAVAFGDAHELKPLPFDAAKLKGLSARLIESHWSNNYGGSVRALNETNRRLSAALTDRELPAFIYNDLKREHLMRTGSVVLHELYFDNLGGDGSPAADVRTLIGSAFGDFDRWESEFRRIAAGLGGGSGWVVLGYNRHLQVMENYWMADHMHSPAATQPLLVLDMYEHSYHMDYGAATARYVDAFFGNINWDSVARRVETIV